MLDKKNILGVGITNATEKEILEYLLKSIEKKEDPYYIVTPNPEILVFSQKNKEFKNICNRAQIALADGVGIIWAAKLLGTALKERVTGVDLLQSICKAANEKPITVGFLGGREGVAEKTAKCLISKYPNLKVSFVGEEWPSNQGAEVANENFRGCECAKVLSLHKHVPASQTSKNFVSSPRLTRNSQLSTLSPRGAAGNSQFSIDILFVAFGFPKQEEWIAKNLDILPIKVAIGVGGSFDYLSGKIPRAPVWVQNLGFEWLYRLVAEPWRLKRQTALLEFIYLVIKEKIHNLSH